jgi:hypothetical protein
MLQSPEIFYSISNSLHNFRTYLEAATSQP